MINDPTTVPNVVNCGIVSIFIYTSHVAEIWYYITIHNIWRSGALSRRGSCCYTNEANSISKWRFFIIQFMRHVLRFLLICLVLIFSKKQIHNFKKYMLSNYTQILRDVWFQIHLVPKCKLGMLQNTNWKLWKTLT